MSRYYIDYSLKNGLGKPSISIYLAGCDKPKKCKNCHNWELQEQNKNSFDIESIKREIDMEINNFLEFHNDLNVSLLGGEPLSEYNRDITLEVTRHINAKYKNVTTILYSWRNIEQIDKECLKQYVNYFDYGVLGGYEETLHKDGYLPSSSNQYIYDFINKKKIKPIKIKRG